MLYNQNTQTFHAVGWNPERGFFYDHWVGLVEPTPEEKQRVVNLVREAIEESLYHGPKTEGHPDETDKLIIHRTRLMVFAKVPGDRDFFWWSVQKVDGDRVDLVRMWPLYTHTQVESSLLVFRLNKAVTDTGVGK